MKHVLGVFLVRDLTKHALRSFGVNMLCAQETVNDTIDLLYKEQIQKQINLSQLALEYWARNCYAQTPKNGQRQRG